MKNFKCVECQNNIDKKNFFKEAFDIDDFFLNKNKNFICKNCGAEYEITTFYKVLTVALRLFILLPFSFFAVLFAFYFLISSAISDKIGLMVSAVALVSSFITLFVYLLLFFVIVKTRKFVKTNKKQIKKLDVKEIIYPKPSEHLSSFQLFIKNKFSKNITKLEINLMYLYIILAGIFILILSNSFVGKSALSYKFVNLMSFIPAVEFSYQYISLEKAFFISSSFLCMLVYFLIIIKQSLINNLHEYGLFNIYELQDKKFYDRVAIRGEWPIIIFGLPITWLGFCWMFYDFFFIGVYLTQEDSFLKLYIYYILCFSGFLYIAIPFMFGTYLVLKNKIISVKKDKNE